MKGFGNITDNNLLAFLFTATTFTENCPPETQRINFIKLKSVNFSLPCEMYTFSLSYYLWIIENQSRYDHRMLTAWTPIFIR